MLATLCLAPGAGAASGCTDSVRIDSVSYAVGEPWCGRRLDSAAIARPSELVRLPDSLSFEDYRIYVTPATRRAFLAMAAAARKDGIRLIVDSGYRSVAYQRRLIARRLAEGKSFAAITKFVAPPGYSQHHTGRAVDLIPSDPSFAKSKTYAWLSEHAASFGFRESYPRDFAGGLHWESWHWMFVGDDRP